MTMIFKLQVDFDREEAFQYRPGQQVELKQRPGVVYTIAEYDPMMVPPISLANDPQPRYPEELNLLPNLVPNWFCAPASARVHRPMRSMREKVLL